MAVQCIVYRLGLIPYQQSWELQERLAEQIATGEHPPALLLLEHSHTYTFGRRGRAENLLWGSDELARRGVSVLWVDRGGDVTYHGPGQLVGYPLLPLAQGGLHASRRASAPVDDNQDDARASDHRVGAQVGPYKADYIGYLRKLEETLILALLRLGIPSGQIEGLTGVWVQPDVLSRCRACAPDLRQPPAKIASIGVKVDVHGVSRHGFALNVSPDMSYWEGIVACGLRDYPQVSLAELRQPPPDMAQVIEQVTAAFGQVFGYEMVERPISL